MTNYDTGRLVHVHLSNWLFNKLPVPEITVLLWMIQVYKLTNKPLPVQCLGSFPGISNTASWL
jgi:hypothetical protein